MQEVLNIIDSNFIDKFSKLFSKPKFYGNIYSNNKEGTLNIDRNTLNYLINKNNIAYRKNENDDDLFSLTDKMYLVFINEIFEKSESIWREDRNHYRSAILTSYGIVTLYSEETTGTGKLPDNPILVFWDEIDHIELVILNDGNDDFYALRFFEKNGTSEIDIPLNRFGTDNKKSAILLVNLFNGIIDILSKKEESVLEESMELEISIFNAIENKNFKEANTLLEKYADSHDVNNIKDDHHYGWTYYTNKAIALAGIGDMNEALFNINKFIKMCYEVEDVLPLPMAHKIKGDILNENGNLLEAINCYAFSEENFISVESAKTSSKLKQATYEKIKNDFVDIPYDKRKLIFPSDDIYNTVKNDLILVKKNEIPNGLNFPIGHPHINEVYTCHPLKKDFYLPLKEFQQELFYDRVNEFTYLLQCLGATKIVISSSKNNSIVQNEKLNKNLNVEANNKIAEAKLNIKDSSNNNNLTDNKLKIEKTQVFSPTKAPYIPENLIWFKTDMSWQRLAEQRLNGNISKHQEVITSIQNEIVSNQEISNINAELRFLLPKVNVQYDKEHEINVNSKTSFEWIISVDFESTDLLKDVLIEDNKTETNENIERYKEDVLFMLEDDNIIDENERRILDRKIKKYGLTKEESLKAENEVMQRQFSESELSYIEELKDILEDGEITEIESIMLDRYAKKFGLDVETKDKINKMFIK